MIASRQQRRRAVQAVVFGIIACGSGYSVAEEVLPSARSGALVVTATRVEHNEFDLPFSIDRLGPEHIADLQPRVNLSESLARVPGVVAQTRQNYAQDLQISIRGFGARASFGIRGIRLLVDGIPVTMPDGQGQAAGFDLDAAQSIEVLRGPFSALYGNAAGGVIQMFSARAPDHPTVAAGLLAGTYDTRRSSLSYGGRHDAIDASISAARFDSDGYRAHSAVRRDTSTARLNWQTASGARITLLADGLRQPETQDPLGLTRAQWDQNPRQAGSNAESFNTRKSIAHTQGGVTLEQPLDANASVTVTGYGGRRDVRQFLAFAGAGASQSGGVIDLDRIFYGLNARWMRRWTQGPQPVTLTLGVEHNVMDERRRGFVNNSGVAGDLRRDEDDRVYDLDLYAQLEWEPGPRWRVITGLRRSRVVFESRDYYITGPANPDDSGRAVYTRTSPMLGVLYAASETVNFYANAGEGFETPTFAELAYRPDGVSGFNFALRPAISRHAEAGLKAYLGPESRLNLALFRVRTDDEIVPGPTAAPGRATFRNAERTARDGVELSLSHRIAPELETYLAGTWLDARFDRYVDFSGADLSGRALPGVPRTTLHGELRWRPRSELLAVLEARRVAKIPVNDANTDTAPAYTLVNARLGWSHARSDWRIQPYLRIDNLLDKNYIGSVIVNASNNAYFEPAPRRHFSVGVQLRAKL